MKQIQSYRLQKTLGLARYVRFYGFQKGTMGMFRLVERAFRFSSLFAVPEFYDSRWPLVALSIERLEACSIVHICPLKPKLDLYSQRIFKNLNETFGRQKSILPATYHATT